jgi:hypothetical protein
MGLWYPTQVPGPCYDDDYAGSRDPHSGRQHFFVGGFNAVARRPPHVLVEAAALCAGGCSPLCWRLQPHEC